MTHLKCNLRTSLQSSRSKVCVRSSIGHVIMWSKFTGQSLFSKFELWDAVKFTWARVSSLSVHMHMSGSQWKEKYSVAGPHHSHHLIKPFPSLFFTWCSASYREWKPKVAVAYRRNLEPRPLSWVCQDLSRWNLMSFPNHATCVTQTAKH